MSDSVEEIVPDSSAKEVQGTVDYRDYSSSSSTDGDDFRRPTNDQKPHLFGRQKPVHAALGGGKRMSYSVIVISRYLTGHHDNNFHSYKSVLLRVNKKFKVKEFLNIKSRHSF